MGVGLEIQRVTGMVYMLRDKIRVQGMACEHFNGGMRLCLENT
jgi:hypothetical protein